MPRLSCVLSMTDSTTAAGWLRKSKFKEDDEGEVQLRLKRETARNFAVTTMKQEIKLYSQWFPGERNEVTDSLSRDFHIPTQRLTNLLRHAAPSQVPPNFSIRALPQKISSWVGALLQQLLASTQGKENHQKSKLLLGRSGDTFSEASNLTTTTSSNTLPNHSALSSSPALPKPHESHTILQALTAPWLSAQSEVPWITWRQPLGRTTTQTQDLTKTGRLTDFYSNSTKVIKGRIRQRNNKKQRHPPSLSKSPKTEVGLEREQ